MLKHFLLAALIGSSIAFSSLAQQLTLNHDVPEVYEVKKGDTLWDISSLYLKNPWHWPSLWDKNPHVGNPHLIYPGDQLHLVFVNGKPQLQIKRSVKFSPQMKLRDQQAIDLIPLSILQPFLTKNQLVDPIEFKQAGMVIGADRESKYFLDGNSVYVNRNLDDDTQYITYRKAKDFIDPDTGELIGVEVEVTGKGVVVEADDVSTVHLSHSYTGVSLADKVKKADYSQFYQAAYYPKPATVEAKIIGGLGSIREMGKYDIVYLNKGSNDNVSPGDVFSAYQEGKTVIIDEKGKPLSIKGQGTFYSAVGETYTLPNKYRGEIMVVKTFPNVSSAIIMNAKSPMRILDLLQPPKD